MKTTITCKICGKSERLDHYNKIAQTELIMTQMCHTCHHWHTQHQLDQNERGGHGFAIIEGTHYVLYPPFNSYFKGYGGYKFRIKFHDGYETTCNNLWCQGEIPEGYWRDLLPDNAQFVWEDRK